MLRNRLALLALAGAAAASARADDVLCLEDGAIERLNTTDGTFSGRRVIKGVHIDGYPMLAIDTNPMTGVLFGIAAGRLHTIDAESGWATSVGPEFGPSLQDWHTT